MRKHLRPLVLLCTLTAACGTSPEHVPTGTPETLEPLTRAIEAWDRGQEDLALAAFREAAEAAPTWPGVWAWWTEAATSEPQREELRTRLSRIVGGLSGGAVSLPLRTLLAALDPDLGRRESALRELLIETGDTPASRWPLVALGELELQRASPQAALESFEAALAMEPGAARALRGEARALMALGRQGDARPAIMSYLKARPTDPVALYNLGWIELNGRAAPEAALPFLERADALRPADVAVLTAIGTAALRLADPDPERARRAWERALVLAPRDPDVLWNLGVLYLDHVDRPERALEMLRRYLEAGGEERTRVAAWIHALEEGRRP